MKAERSIEKPHVGIAVLETNEIRVFSVSVWRDAPHGRRDRHARSHRMDPIRRSATMANRIEANLEAMGACRTLVFDRVDRRRTMLGEIVQFIDCHLFRAGHRILHQIIERMDVQFAEKRRHGI